MSSEKFRPHKKTEKEKPNLTRRTFIAGLAAAGLAAAGELEKYSKREHVSEETPERVEAPQEHELDVRTAFLRYEAKPQWYKTPKLTGRKFGYPITVYFGYNNSDGFANERPEGTKRAGQPVVFGPKTSVDFKFQLAQACMLKAYDLGIVKADGAPQISVGEAVKRSIEKSGNDPRIQLMNKLVMDYDPENCGRMSLQEYFDSIGYSIDRVSEEMNWNRIQHDHKLSGPQMGFLRSAVQKIDAEALFAINLTEVMHSDDPAVLDVFETLLQTAGSQFIYRIPSDADLKMSFGPAQLTAELFKMKHQTKAGEVTRLGSVSHMSLYLKHALVPDDISKVEGSQHHMASYLNAVDNLILLARSLKNEKAMQLIKEPISDDIRVFIGAAHNNPGAALEAFDRFSSAYLVAKGHGTPKLTYTQFTKQQVKGFANISKYTERIGLSMAVVRYGDRIKLAKR